MAPTRRRRTGLWATVAVVVLALAGGAATIAMNVLRDDKRPAAAQSPAGPLPSQPTPSPRQPGLEPPKPGDWPKWPEFTPTDKVKRQSLDGAGLTLTLPAAWTCVPAANGQDWTRHNCGTTVRGEEIGGEITVRTCTKPCNVERRDEMRKAEEAWGQQWRFAGEYAVIAETKAVNGGSRYGLVVVGFWRSAPDDAVDRQLVLRMTAPAAWIDEIRRVANAARAAARF